MAATTAPGAVVVTDEQRRLAYRQLRRANWPATFEAAMDDDLYRRLIHGLALRLGRAAWTPAAGHRSRLPQAPVPPTPAVAARPARLGAWDAKRAAANDRD